jgi:4-carboxymuconolactone decarboxylase
MNGSEERGVEMLRRMLGEERAREVRESWTKLSPDFARYVTNFLAGEVWERPNLDLKTRSLITVSALAALGRTNGLRLNIEMALNNGATRAEILETLLQMAPYAGFPACWDALVIADEVFKQRQPEKA